jgi:predicted nucleic acid-binding Zn ribbon protein
VDQKISDPPIKECSSCKKEEARRQIAGGSFLLKGGGWYKDGYSGKNR